MVLRPNSCPECKGDVWLDLDEYGWYEQCTMCGYLCSLEGIKYIDSAESMVVSRQGNPKVYSLRSLLETLRSAMQMRVQEAKEYIIAELSQGALERRQLMTRLIKRGIFKDAFDMALKQLRETGMVAGKPSGKRRRKLVLGVSW